MVVRAEEADLHSPALAFGLAAMLSLPFVPANGAVDAGSQALTLSNLEVTALPGHAPTDAACVPALARALAQFSMIVKLEALRGLAGMGTPDAAAAVAGEWDHLAESEKASAFRWFSFSGSEALLRTALATRRERIQ